MHRTGSGVAGATDGSELHERSITARRQWHQPQPSAPFPISLPRNSKPVSIATYGATLGMTCARFMSGCPAQAELPLSSPHNADGLAMKGEGAYKYQVTLARVLLAQTDCGPASLHDCPDK